MSKKPAAKRTAAAKSGASKASAKLPSDAKAPAKPERSASGSFRFPAVAIPPAESDAERETRRRRLEHLGQLASGLAHEIKNPLSTMKLNLQLLQEDWRDAQTDRDRRTARKVNILMDEIKRLETILEDFLAFARGNELELELADIRVLIGEVADFIEPELKAARITLWSGVRSDLPLIPIDRKKLKQALLNLVINARQAMEEVGGGELFLTAHRDGSDVVIEVADTGPGIPPQLHDRVFDVYFSTKRGGTGLGLPTVRRIVEEHGGRLLLRSQQNHGTQFLLILPITR